jgi:HEAT repeat protein
LWRFQRVASQTTGTGEMMKPTGSKVHAQGNHAASPRDPTGQSEQDPTALGPESPLIALAAPAYALRRQTREHLVAAGRSSVPVLTEALRNRRQVVRWEAAKALSEMALPETAPALVDALEDEDAGVRWLAAEGLIALGRKGVIPLLQALARRPDSQWLRDGAHHALHALMNEKWAKPLEPVLGALMGFQADVAAPLAADAALREFEKK